MSSPFTATNAKISAIIANGKIAAMTAGGGGGGGSAQTAADNSAQLAQLASQQAAAQKAAEEAAAQQKLLQTQLDDLKLANTANIEAIRAGYDQKLIETTSAYDQRLAGLTTGYDQRIADLNNLLIGNENKFNTQLQQQQQSSLAQLTALDEQYGSRLAQQDLSFQGRIKDLENTYGTRINEMTGTYQANLAALDAQRVAAEGAYAEMRAQSDNLARAYVPNTQASAAAPQIGDARSLAQEARPRRANTLSSLSIISSPYGMSGAMQPLAGLQIA
jgi:hypothetical protein